MWKRRNVLRFLLTVAGCLPLVVAAWQVFDPRVARLWTNTAWLACGAALLAVPIGTLLALAIAKTDVPGRWEALWLLVAMLFVPLFLIAGAWDAGFGLQGWRTLASNPHLSVAPWLSGWRAAIWIHALGAVPPVALIVVVALRAVEPELEEDAALCAPPWRVLVHVTIPRIAPAFLVASLLVAVTSTIEIAVTDLYQIRTFAEEVYTQSALGSFDFDPAVINNWPSAPLGPAGLWFGVLLSGALGVALLAAAGRLGVDVADARQSPSWIWRLARMRWLVAATMWSILLLVVGVPIANLVQKSGVLVTATETGRVRTWSMAKAVERVASAPWENRGEILQTIVIGTGATTAALAFGAPLAWSLRGARRTPFFRFVAIALCLTIPGPVLGVAVIRLLNQSPDSPLAFLAPLYDSRFAPWLVQTIRALPMVALVLWAALATVPQSIIDAATTDGVGWWGQLLRIALPQRLGAVVAAWIIGLAVCAGELAATILVMPPARHTVISVRVFQLLHYGVDDRVAAISLVMALGIAALTAIAALLARRMVK